MLVEEGFLEREVASHGLQLIEGLFEELVCSEVAETLINIEPEVEVAVGEGVAGADI